MDSHQQQQDQERRISQDEGDHDPESKSGDRPSFTTFWKRSVQALTPSSKSERSLTFVPSSGSGNVLSSNAAPGSDGDHGKSDKALSAQEKAQARRAQVRKAQKQHRQRKENYIKQLEIDVARFLELIDQTKEESRALARENEAIRAKIKQAYPAAGPSADSTLMSPPGSSLGVPAFTSGSQDMEGVTLSLGFDESINALCYRVSSSPSPSQGTTTTRQAQQSPEGSLPEVLSTPEQTQEAINFILALEQICRNHFHPSHFQSSTADPSGVESGHTLMATHLALRTAPESIFKSPAKAAIDAISSKILPNHHPQPPKDDNNEDVSWQASGLTLQSLHGLACSFNKAADIELTPVQAWFELAERYPSEVLMQKKVLDGLKRELVGVVKCPHYGAWMERMAYESVVERVVEPEMEAYRSREHSDTAMEVS